MPSANVCACVCVGFGPCTVLYNLILFFTIFYSVGCSVLLSYCIVESLFYSIFTNNIGQYFNNMFPSNVATWCIHLK